MKRDKWYFRAVAYIRWEMRSEPMSLEEFYKRIEVKANELRDARNARKSLAND